MADETKIWETSELTFCAYIAMRAGERNGLAENVRYLNTSIKHSGRYEFTFSDPDGVCDQLCQEFTSSESQRYDAQMSTMRKLVAKLKR